MRILKNERYKNLSFLLLDAFLLVGFWLLNQPRLTGIVIHEWFGILFFLFLLWHAGLHWRWVVNIFRKFFKVRSLKQYARLVVDILGLIAFLAIMISGILISKSFLPTLGLSAMRSHSLKLLHAMATNAAVAMLALHLLLNVKWIIKTIAGLFTRRRYPAGSKLPQPE